MVLTQTAQRLMYLSILVALLTGIVCTSAYALPGMTNVSGSVVDAETGQPALGVDYAVYSRSGDGWNLQGWGSVSTTGRFSLEVYNSSASHVVLLKGGATYLDMGVGGSPFSWDESWGSSWPTDLPDSATFQLAKNVVPKGNDISIGTTKVQPRPVPYGAVSGLLTEQFGNALRNEVVRAWRLDESSGEWSRAGWTQPNEAGLYTIAGTAEHPLTGKVKIEINTWSAHSQAVQFYGGQDFASAREIQVKPGQTIYGINHRATILNRIHGRVMSAETKKPLRYVHAELQTNEAEYSCATGDQTLADGSFFLGRDHGVPADQYVVQLQDPLGRYYPDKLYFYGQTMSRTGAKAIDVENGQVYGGIDVWFSSVPAIASTVVNSAGVPLPDVLVRAYQVQADGELTVVGSDYTDSLGMYRVLCPSAGKYTLQFIDQAGTKGSGDDVSVWLGGSDSAATATRISVTNGRASVPARFAMTPADSGKASRVYGMDEYEAAIMVSQSSFGSNEASCVVIASGSAWADALSGSNLTGVVEGPMLLTRFDAIPPGVVAELDRLGAKKIYLMGGPKTISVRQEETYRAHGFEVERIGGADRFDVNANSVDEAAETLASGEPASLMSLTNAEPARPAFVTSGLVYPDALAVAPVVHSRKGTVLLAKSTGVSKSVLNAASTLGVTQLVGVGGPSSLTSAARTAFKQRGMAVTVVAAGKDRYDTAALFAQWAKGRGFVKAGRIGLANGLRFQESLVAGPALGSTGHALVLTRCDAMPPSSLKAAAALRGPDGLEAVAYGDTKQVSSKVLTTVGTR